MVFGGFSCQNQSKNNIDFKPIQNRMKNCEIQKKVFFSRFWVGLLKLILEDWEEKRQLQKKSRLGCQVFPLYPFIFA